MKQTVGTAIGQSSDTLLAKLSENVQIANTVMALVGKIVILAAEHGVPINGVKFGPVVADGSGFGFQLSFSRLDLSQSMGLIPAQDDLLQYIATKSTHLAKAVSGNPEFCRTLRDFVLKVESYCKHRGIVFADYRVKTAFVTREDVVRIQTDPTQKGRWD